MPRARLDQTVGEAIAGLLAHPHDCVHICCVLYASGPLATIVQDLLSLLTYFVTVGAIMQSPA